MLKRIQSQFFLKLSKAAVSMPRVAASHAKNILLPLYFTAVVSAADPKLEQMIHENSLTVFISNE